ncbi:Bax inhibitor-1/YccA family protein [Coraliomargarita akajimensis]|uniref:Permease n=1 Tax=Coraliomargarita akajimensis (strain DSM 45221 / IAM 15411 / JCM 23193 / KCTC 12865 / 04OKA010-24) TaxID=583355 RepID=D5EQC3_CORAD|nr:Bax inhibitor-1 family protein [Coraliomargarita akajimensis]ADE53891.1 conserved hypothetical protein [Coraliomargarita akajimensis DSM 45221]
MFQENYATRSLADAAPNTRAQFIRRTYLHLALALLAFVGVEVALLQSETAINLAASVLSAPYGWLMVIGGMMVVGWMATGFAHSASKPVQYLGLGLYVVMEACIFLPLILIALSVAGDASLLVQAGLMTGLLFAGLTATVFVTRSDFSFLRTFLMVGGAVAIGLIVCSILFGFTLGTVFSVLMVAFAAGAILYDTSNILHHYNEDQYVGAALSLFASVAMLLWYVLRILISLRD